MRRYYIDAQEVSEREAMSVEAQNAIYLNSDNLSDWLKCKFIICIEA